jgi:DNA-binding NtrC family response regulator
MLFPLQGSEKFMDKKAFFIFFFLTLSLFGESNIFVGIAGGTGSGKTTLAEKIHQAFPGVGDNQIAISLLLAKLKDALLNK